MDNVLVLNRLWQAIQVCSVRVAMAHLWTGNAEVVLEQNGDYLQFSYNEWADFSADHNGEDVVRTVTAKLRIPKVILLKFFDRLPQREVKFTRMNVFERDNDTCQYCGYKGDRKEMNIDHVIPRDHGGKTEWENIVLSCIPCNSRKANRTPAQAGMRLRKLPKRPRWRPMLKGSMDCDTHKAWEHFIDIAYWHVELTN